MGLVLDLHLPLQFLTGELLFKDCDLNTQGLKSKEESTSGRIGFFDKLLFCVVIFVVGLSCSWLDEPWDGSHAGLNSGNYSGYACRGFERHGYFDVGGIPSKIHHAGSGDVYVPYVNHPPTFYLFLYPCYLVFGMQEASIRTAMLFVFLCTLLFMRIFLSKIYGREVAGLSTTIFASLPVIVQFMGMADPLIFVLPFLIPTVYFWFRHLRLCPGSSLWPYFIVAFLAGMMDWHAYFIVVALWIDLLCSRERTKRRLYHIGLPFGVSFILTGIWIALASRNSLEEIGDFLVMTKDSILGERVAYGPTLVMDPSKLVQAWFSRVGQHFEQQIQLPVLLISVLGLILVLTKSRKNNVGLRFVFVLIIAGVIPFVAAYSHAFVHEFWPIMLAPALALLAAIVFQCTAGPKPGLRLALAAILLLALVATNMAVAIEFHSENRREHPKAVALQMNDRFGKNDLVLSASGLCSQRFYANFTMVSNIFHPDLYEGVMQQLYDSQDQFSKLYIFWPKDARQDYHWLEAGNFPVNYVFREDFDGIDTAIVELNLKKTFARIKKR